MLKRVSVLRNTLYLMVYR